MTKSMVKEPSKHCSKYSFYYIYFELSMFFFINIPYIVPHMMGLPLGALATHYTQIRSSMVVLILSKKFHNGIVYQLVEPD